MLVIDHTATPVVLREKHTHSIPAIRHGWTPSHLIGWATTFQRAVGARKDLRAQQFRHEHWTFRKENHQRLYLRVEMMNKETESSKIDLGFGFLVVTFITYSIQTQNHHCYPKICMIKW